MNILLAIAVAILTANTIINIAYLSRYIKTLERQNELLYRAIDKTYELIQLEEPVIDKALGITKEEED